MPCWMRSFPRWRVFMLVTGKEIDAARTSVCFDITQAVPEHDGQDLLEVAVGIPGG